MSSERPVRRQAAGERAPHRYPSATPGPEPEHQTRRRCTAATSRLDLGHIADSPGLGPVTPVTSLTFTQVF